MGEQLHIILVPHTHWDREWYQTFQQFRMRLIKTVDLLLDVLDSDLQFYHFMLDGQTVVLDDYLEVKPEQRERLAGYIRSGRILTGPWYLQPDEFLVSGEALIRNLQIGLRRAAEFGTPMRVGYVPDTFGHIAQLPQLLHGFGIESAVFWRGVGAEARKSEFFWRAPDGTRVLVLHLADPIGYSNARQMPLQVDEFVTRTELLVANILPKATTDTLLFMNGSDHLEPQVGLPAVIAAANQQLAHIDPRHQHLLAQLEAHHGPSTVYDTIEVHIGTLPEYIERVRQWHEQHGQKLEAVLQTLTGEMRSGQFAPLLPSVLSTRMWIKQQNSATEHLLERWVEPLTVWASLVGKNVPYPQELVALAWRYLLQNHAHDSICGCSVDQVHRENGVRFAQSQQVGEGLVDDAMQQLTAVVNTLAPFQTPHTSAMPVPIVVFNPAPGPRTEVVQATVQLPGSLHNAVIVDARGQHMPYRIAERRREELGSMPVAREMLATAAMFAGVTTPEQFLQMARSLMASFTGQSDDMYDLTRIYIEDYTESPIHHEPHSHQPGVIYVELMIAAKGRTIINTPDIHRAAQQLLDLLQREDIHTFEVSLVDQAREMIELLAADLPAYGLKTFWLYPRGLSDAPELPAAYGEQIHAHDTTIENAYYRVEANPQDGTLTITDKETNAVFTGLHRFVDGGDVGDLYNYCPPEHDTLVSTPAEPPKIELVQVGPLRAMLRVSGRWALPGACTANRSGRSERATSCPIVSEIAVTSGVRRVDIHTSVDNRVRDHRLRVFFPVPYVTQEVASEATFEVRIRPVEQPRPENIAEWIEEPSNTFPQKRFVDVRKGEIGLAILNRGLPEYEVVRTGPGIAEDGEAIALTLLRCVEWLSRGDLATRRGHAGPMEHTPEAQCLGRQEFDYAIVPHRGSWETDEAFILREAQAFNTPLTTRAIVTDAHEGQLPNQTTLLSVEPRELVISAIKRAKQGNGFVVRLYNPLMRPLRAHIRPGIAYSTAYRANLLEETIGEPLDVVVADKGTMMEREVVVEIGGGGIMTVIFVA